MGIVVVSWRQGKNDIARETLCEAESMGSHKTKLQQFVFVACRAQQGLLDGDQKVCWHALSLATRLAPDANDSSKIDSQIARLATFMGYHHVSVETL